MENVTIDSVREINTKLYRVWVEVTGTECYAGELSRLISAAPDLLAALKDVLFALENGVSCETLVECSENGREGMLYCARAAIKKAKGEI